MSAPIKFPTRVDPPRSARDAGLSYTSDAAPGIRRVRNGRGFRYLTPQGKPLRNREDLARIRSLAIPPAWTDVWICANSRGHLQATGRDARGRKQYRYHPKWHETRDETKYDRLIAFAQALPALRRRTAADLRRSGLRREKVLATVVQLLEKTLIRVGNGEYARQNHSFGLTTLRDGHVAVNGHRIRFSFRGKSGVEHDLDVEDRRLARIVRACRDIPGYELFQYYDDEGERQTIGSADVNEYLKRTTGRDFTSKDFRTWAGTVLAAELLRDARLLKRPDGRGRSAGAAKKDIVRAVEAVAKRLGNTKAVCRKCYIHPAILDAYVDGTMFRTIAQRARRLAKTPGLSEAEAAVLQLLQRRLAGETRRRAS